MGMGVSWQELKSLSNFGEQTEKKLRILTIRIAQLSNHYPLTGRQQLKIPSNQNSSNLFDQVSGVYVNKLYSWQIAKYNGLGKFI